jgi:hypothetical protein
MKSIKTVFGGPYHGRNLSEFLVLRSLSGGHVYLTPKPQMDMSPAEDKDWGDNEAPSHTQEPEYYEVIPIYKKGVHIADATVHGRHCKNGRRGNFTENFLQFLRSEGVSVS